MSPLVKKINAGLAELRKTKNPVQRFFKALIVFTSIVWYAARAAYHTVFSDSYASFNYESAQHTDGTYAQSFHEHQARKKRTRLLSLSSIGVVVVSFGIVTFITNILGLQQVEPVYAVSYTWDGGGGADTNWSTCSNWTSNTCPGSGDIAVFDTTNTGSSTVDAGYAGSVGGLDINAGYTGTITVARELTIGASNLAQDDGTLTFGASGLDLNGTFTLAGGTFTAPSGNWTISSSFTHTAGGTFNHNNGLLTADGGNATYNFDTVSTTNAGQFYDVTVNKTGTQYLAVSTGDTLYVNRNFVGTNGVLVNTGTIQAKATTTISSTADGGSGTLEIAGASTQAVTVEAGAITPKFTLNNASATVSMTGSGTITWGVITVTTGIFNASSLTHDMAGGFSMSGGTANFNTSTTTIGGAGNLAVSGGTFDADTATITLTDPLVLSAGTFNADAAAISTSEGLTHTAGGTFTAGTSTFTFTGNTKTIDIDTASTTNAGVFNNLTINKNNVQEFTVATGDTLTVNGTLSYTNGDITTGIVQAKGTTTVGAAADGGSGTLQIAGASTQEVTVEAGAITPKFTLNNASATVSMTGSGTVTWSGLLTITTGILNAGSLTQTLSAGFAQSGGTSNWNTSTVSIDGGTIAISGGTFDGDTSSQDWNDAYTQTAGTVNLDGGSYLLSEAFDHNTAGTFTAGTSTFTFDGNAKTIDINTSGTTNAGVFYNVVLNKNTGLALTVASGDTLLATGSTQFTNGLYQTGIWEARGSVTVASTYDGSTSGSLLLSGGNTQSFDLTGATGLINNDISVNKSGGAVNLASALVMDGSSQDLIIQEGTFDLSSYALTVNGTSGTFITETGGNLQLQGDETITANATYPQIDSGSTVTYDATTGTRNIKDYSYHHLTINGSGGSFTLGGTESAVGDFTVTAGTFDANDQTMGVGGNTVINGGTVLTGTNTFTFGNAAGDSVTISSGGLQIESDDTSSDVVKNAGTWTNSGGTITYNAATTVSTALLSSISPYKSLTVNSTGSTYALNGAIEANGTLTITAGTVDTSSGNNYGVTAEAWVDGASGSFTERSGIVTFDGTGTVTTDESFYDLTLNSSGTLTLGAALDVDNNLTITDGNLDVDSTNNYGITVGKNWSNSDTFTARSGIVAFNDASKTSVVAGSTAFRSLSVTTAGKAINFTAGTTQTVNGTLTFTGASGSLITLRSTVTDSSWGLTANGTISVSYVDVKDSNASGGSAITQTNSTNNGGNTNWVFNNAPSAPTSLFINTTANGAATNASDTDDLTDTTPVFSALYNDSDAGDIANKYCIQVNTASDFSGTNLWYSDSATCSSGSSMSNLTAGSRSGSIEYAGTSLTCGTTYYWRIKFWDDEPAEGANASAANFEVNCTPSATSGSASVTEDTTFTGTLASSDGDSDAVTYSIVSNGSKGTATISNSATGAYSYVPTANANGSDSFTFKVNDGTEDSSTATLSVTIAAVNDTPTANAGADQTVTEDQTISLSGSSSSDIDGNTLTYSWAEVSDSSDGCSISSSTSQTASLALLNKESSFSCVVSLVVNDGTVDSATDSVTITVTASNDAPAFTSDIAASVDIDAGDHLVIPVSADDDDSSTVELSASDVGGNFADVTNYFTDSGSGSGTFDWDTTTDDTGDYTVAFTAADSANQVSQEIAISVTIGSGENTAPTFTGSLPNVTFYAGITTPVVFDLDDYFSDSDGDSLTYTAAHTDNVTTSISDGAVTFTAPTSAAGDSEAIEFVATDPSGATVESNPIVVSMDKLGATDIGFITGKSKGKGIVTVFDTNGDKITSWQAFGKGGAIPKISDNSRIYVVKSRFGTTIHAYTLTGKLLKKKRISPKLHWRRFNVGDLDSNANTDEVVTGTRRGSTMYFKIYRFAASDNSFNLVKRGTFRHKSVKKPFRLQISDQKVHYINAKGKNTFNWIPFK